LKRLLEPWANAIVIFAFGCSAEVLMDGTQGTDNQDYPSGGSTLSGVAGVNGSSQVADGNQPQVFPVGVCDEQNFYPKPKEVAVMLLQDLSLSMTVDLEGKPKWKHAKDAITALLTDPVYKDMGIHFGFDYFPDTSSKINPNTKDKVVGCGVDDPVAVDADVNSNSKIIGWINGHEPNGATPLYCAINKFRDPTYAPKFYGASMEKYLVVISDGADACGTDGVSVNAVDQFAKPTELEQVTTQLATAVPTALDVKKWPIQTIAIGFGNGVAPSELNAIAKAGGVFDTYIDAKNSDDLQRAFKTIGNKVVSCIWEIQDSGVRADRHKVNFYVDNNVVPYLGENVSCASKNGWIWTKSNDAVEFCSDACVKIRKGMSMAARFGCPSLQ
jgi:hypothetical protein